MRDRRVVLGVWVVLLALCGCACAQRRVLGTAEAGDGSVDAVLHGMVARAGVIFTGTVVEVRRPAVVGGGAGAVEVVFAVEQGLRGAVTGGTYVLREWGGLWQGDEQRYRVGERRLMLLHGSSAGGLSSPVGGMDGAIPIRPAGTGAAAPVVDLRWVATRVSRGAVQYRAETPRIPKARPMAEVLHLPGEVTPVAEDGDGERTTTLPDQKSVAAECASMSSVVAAIRLWTAEPR